MKNTKKLIIIAASLVLASALALCGCMQLISNPSEETKEYSQGEMSLPSVIEQTPTAQREMQKKFGAYGREEIGEDGEKIFYLFTEEQIKESLEMRKDGIRRSLTYDEILFIINDSVRMYFEYDKIFVTDFAEHTDFPQLWEHFMSDSFTSLIEYEKCREFFDSFRYEPIETYHGDFSDYPEYISALSGYSSMVYDIEAIIAERLRIYDTGSEFYCSEGDAYWDETHVYGILLDGGELTDINEYRSYVKKAFELTLLPISSIRIEYPMLFAKRVHDHYSADALLSIEYYENGNVTELFPTEQVKAMKPGGENLTLIWMSEEQIGFLPQRCIRLEFDRWREKVTFSNRVLSSETTLTGTYKLDGERMILEFGEGKTIILEADGDFVRPAGAYYSDGKNWLYFEDSIVFEIRRPLSGEKITFPESFFNVRYK